MTSATRRVRVMTCNLWNGGANPAALAEVLEREDPDVVLAQELHPTQAEVLAAHFDAGLLRAQRDTHGMGIALRHPAPVRELPMPLRNFLATRLSPVDWPGLGQPLDIFNVHLSSPTGWGRLPQRRVQVARLRAQMQAATGPLLIAGDFNSFPLMPAYWQLKRALSDVAGRAALRSLSPPRATWGLTATSPRLLRIDHMLVGRLRTERFRVIDIAGSDHASLLVDLYV